MSNKTVSRAAALVPGIKDLEEFWRDFGRPDLVGITRYEELRGCPTLQSALHLAIMEVEKRRSAKAREIRDEDGIVVGHKRDPKLPGKPLTQYVRDVRTECYDRPGRFVTRSYYNFLRPTKGWRSEVIDAADRKSYLARGVPLEVGDRYVKVAA